MKEPVKKLPTRWSMRKLIAMAPDKGCDVEKEKTTLVVQAIVNKTGQKSTITRCDDEIARNVRVHYDGEWEEDDEREIPGIWSVDDYVE
ncbi:hypothetical protein FRX31_005772, partial [Thalictrum thalictroides]